MEPADVAVIGGGILGTSVAYWLAARHDGQIVVIERERTVAEHASRRNTGLLHRPFYLHPRKARVFARSAAISYHLWKKYAAEKGLPFVQVGTYEVALDDGQVGVLDDYMTWAVENGMAPQEVEHLDAREMREREPNVRCAAALLSKTDTAVDYRAFTQALKGDAESIGVRFLTGVGVDGVTVLGEELQATLDGGRSTLPVKFLIGCAGGEAVDLAHAMGVGLEYTDLHFRGEYWIVDDRVRDLASRNIYSVPRHRDLPFLDPHWVIRANGQREIGPNAVPVPGPRSYSGLLWPAAPWVGKLLEPPIGNTVRLALNRDFLALSTREMLSSVSKGEMLRRVQQFLPALRARHLMARGTAGIRSTVVNRHGALIKEAIEVPGPHSYHILNYNSPGATGAPAYAAYLVDRLEARGDLDHLTRNPKPQKVWNWDVIAKAMGLAS